MKYTPKPWTYMVVWGVAPDEPTQRNIYGANGYVVAQVDPDSSNNASVDADGRLIAAAPDLLQAAKNLIERVAPSDILPAWQKPYVNDLILGLSAAIQKAEGR